MTTETSKKLKLNVNLVKKKVFVKLHVENDFTLTYHNLEDNSTGLPTSMAKY